MSTEMQKEFGRWGAGDRTNLKVRVEKRIDLVMTAGVTVTANFNLPASASRLTVAFETPTAFSGAPTHINARVGLSSGGQEIVADTDIQAQGHITGTIAAALNQPDITGSTSGQGGSVTPVYLQLAAAGGTNPAGTCSVFISYGA